MHIASTSPNTNVVSTWSLAMGNIRTVPSINVHFSLTLANCFSSTKLSLTPAVLQPVSRNTFPHTLWSLAYSLLVALSSSLFAVSQQPSHYFHSFIRLLVASSLAAELLPVFIHKTETPSCWSIILRWSSTSSRCPLSTHIVLAIHGDMTQSIAHETNISSNIRLYAYFPPSLPRRADRLFCTFVSITIPSCTSMYCSTSLIISFISFGTPLF